MWPANRVGGHLSFRDALSDSSAGKSCAQESMERHGPSGCVTKTLMEAHLLMPPSDPIVKHKCQVCGSSKLSFPVETETQISHASREQAPPEVERQAKLYISRQ